jgi:hypothetical protein
MRSSDDDRFNRGILEHQTKTFHLLPGFERSFRVIAEHRNNRESMWSYRSSNQRHNN